jgi:Calcineurin-like phosphoesterase
VQLKFLLVGLVLAIGLFLSPVNAQTLTQADNKAKEDIISALSDAVDNHYSWYKMINATIGNETLVIYNRTQEEGGIPIPPQNETNPPPVNNETTTPPIEICGDAIDNNENGLADEGCPIIPPVTPDKPSVDVNTTKTLRVAAIGDIDDNAGLDKQLALAKKYNADTLVVPGDYAYSSGSNVLNKIKNADFNHVVIACGNHDSCAVGSKFMGMTQPYGQVTVTPQLDFYLINGNSGIDCSGAQFANVRDALNSSDAWYNVPVIHQPFVTVKNNHHGPNGQFSCWNPLFAGNGVGLVLQAHVHNYQRIDVNGIDYLVVGTGTHDTGSAMYSIDSNDWNGFACQKCMTGVNGITLLDFKIDKPSERQMDGWFVDNSGNVKDKFN